MTSLAQVALNPSLPVSGKQETLPLLRATFSAHSPHFLQGGRIQSASCFVLQVQLLEGVRDSKQLEGAHFMRVHLVTPCSQVQVLQDSLHVSPCWYVVAPLLHDVDIRTSLQFGPVVPGGHTHS